MRTLPVTWLSQELLKLEKARLHTYRNEDRQTVYLMVLMHLVVRYVFSSRRWSDYEHIYGRLYWRRYPRSFVRQLRKDEFEPIRPIRVISGYGLRKIELILLQMLLTALSARKKGKKK